MKLLWDEGLKRRIRIYLTIVAIPILLLFVLVILVGTMGIVGDLIAKPKLNRMLNQMRDEGLQYFEDIRSQGGYLKPQFEGEFEEGNAYDFYLRAMNAMEPVTESEWNTIDDFLSGKEADTARVSLILFRYENQLNDVRRGLKQSRCEFPLESAPMPNF